MRNSMSALLTLTLAMFATACATTPPATTASTATPAPSVQSASATTAPATATEAPATAQVQQPSEYPDGAPRITVDEAVRELNARQAIIVDVRGDEQWNAGHVKGALHIPWNEIAGRLSEFPKDKKIITYCS